MKRRITLSLLTIGFLSISVGLYAGQPASKKRKISETDLTLLHFTIAHTRLKEFDQANKARHWTNPEKPREHVYEHLLFANEILGLLSLARPLHKANQSPENLNKPEHQAALRSFNFLYDVGNKQMSHRTVIFDHLARITDEKRAIETQKNSLAQLVDTAIALNDQAISPSGSDDHLSDFSTSLPC